MFISIRYILKKRSTSAINIFSLSLGGTICILIWSFISFEYGFDQSFSNLATYRLETHTVAEGGPVSKDALTATEKVHNLTRNLSGLQAVTRLVPYSEERNAFFSTLGPDSTIGRVFLQDVFYSDASIFKIFPIQVLQKRPNPANGPGLWLAKSVVIQYFGLDYTANQELWDMSFDAIRNNGLPTPAYQVAGVFEDLKFNTHIQFDAIIVAASDNNPLHHYGGDAYTYVTTSVPIATADRTLNIQDLPEGFSIYARPVTSIHFTEDISNNPKPVANRTLLVFLGVVGLIILLLSITNYTIGTIFNTIERMREIGIRKLIGMKPAHLVANFLTESLLIHLFAGAIAVALFQYMVSHSLPFLPDQQEIGTNNPLNLKAIGSAGLGQTIGFAVVLFLTSTFLSSLYPMFYFNSIRPVYLLKGKLQLLNSSILSGATRVTELLLLFQLIASVIFLSGLFMVNSQLEYLNNQRVAPFDLQVSGIFPGVAGANATFNEMADRHLREARGKGWLRELSFSNLYRNKLTTVGSLSANAIDNTDSSQTIQLRVVDHSYWPSETDIFAAGSNFSSVFGSNPDQVILSEAALRLLDLEKPKDVIGDTLYSDMGKFTLLGVVRQPEQEPIAYVSGYRYRTYMNMTLHYDEAVSRKDNVFDFLRASEVSLSTAFPFITILKRDFQKERFLEQGIGGLFLLFSVLALLIASFGLFSLSSFLTEKRAKEMDIRKLLGANLLQLIQLVSMSLFQMLGWAIIIATPVVFFAGNYWLDQYSARVAFNPLWILSPAVLVLVVSLVVAIPKSWQRASGNLANALRG